MFDVKLKPMRSFRNWTWLWYVPSAFILFWWLYDLQFQWRTLVDYHYGWLVVLLAGYLFLERWPTRPLNDQPAPLWFCTFLVIAGTPLVLAAELYKQAIANTPAASFTLSLGCALYLMANLLYLGGWLVFRHFLFPLLFVILAVPLPAILWNPIVVNLQEFVATLNVQTLNLGGIPASQQASVIRLPNCVVGIDEACSGVRSLQSSVMAALFIGDLTMKKWRSRLAFLIVGVLLALVGNFLRSLYLSTIAYHRGSGALAEVHDTAGWSVLAFTAGGLIVTAYFAARLENASARKLSSKRAEENGIALLQK